MPMFRLKGMLGNAGLLMLSGIVAQTINLLAYPLLTQLYAPAAFGIFAAFLSIATLVGSAICLRLDMVFQVVPSDEERSVFLAALATLTCIALVLVVIVWASSNFVLPVFGADAVDQMPPLMWAVLLVLTGGLIGLTALGRQVRSKWVNYRWLAGAQVARTVVAVLTQVGVFWLVPGFLGLTLGFLSGLIIFCLLTLPLSNTGFLGDQNLISPSKVLMKHQAFIRTDVANVLIGAAVMAMYPIVVLALFGAEKAGFFALASRLSFIPVEFLGAAISTVFFQQFSQSMRLMEGVLALFQRTLFFGILAGLAVALGFLVLSDTFVRFLFDPLWAPTAGLIIALLPTMIVRFYIGCIGSAPLTLKRPSLIFAWNIAQLAILGAVTVVTTQLDLSIENFLWASGSCLFLVSLVYTALLWRAIQNHVQVLVSEEIRVD